MKTKISILVKDETILSKMYSSLLWFIAIFQKSKLDVQIDGQSHVLTASKTPYVFDVEPGYHEIMVYDTKAKGKRNMRRMTGGFFDCILGIMGGGGGSGFADLAEPNLRENGVQCDLQPGDKLSLSCKAKGNGNVKIKIL